MHKPIALDICARKGGATVGLQRAGFYVIAVDIEPQPGNPADEFWHRDGLDVLKGLIAGVNVHSDRLGRVRPALIWQSWPCQAANTATASNRARGLADDHYQFIPEARALSDEIGIPYVLEQPTASVAGTIRRDLTLCMDMFRGDMPPPWVQKHRSFELSGFTVPQPVHPEGPVRGGSMVGFPKPAGHAGRVRGHRHGEVFEGPYVAAYGNGGGKGTPEELAHAMRMPWVIEGMTRGERRARQFDLQEAIPPDFSEYIGRAFLSGQ